MDFMSLFQWKIYICLTVIRLNPDKIWSKDTFSCNYCSYILSVLTSVKLLILITSCPSVKTINNTLNCLEAAGSPTQRLTLITAWSNLINTILNSWSTLVNFILKLSSPRREEKFLKLPRVLSFTERDSKTIKFWCWIFSETVLRMDR